MSSYIGYENFTADNFIVETVSGSTSSQQITTADPSYTIVTSFQITKTYNASTGKLTITAKTQTTFDGEVESSKNLSVKVYLIY